MAIALGLILYGVILVIAGWKNVSVAGLARGDASKPKPKVTAGGAPLTSK